MKMVEKPFLTYWYKVFLHLTKQVSLPPSMWPAHIMCGVSTFLYDSWQSAWSMMFTPAFCSRLVNEPETKKNNCFLTFFTATNTTNKRLQMFFDRIYSNK